MNKNRECPASGGHFYYCFVVNLITKLKRYVSVLIGKKVFGLPSASKLCASYRRSHVRASHHYALLLRRMAVTHLAVASGRLHSSRLSVCIAAMANHKGHATIAAIHPGGFHIVTATCRVAAAFIFCIASAKAPADE